MSVVSTVEILRSCGLQSDAIQQSDHSYCTTQDRPTSTEFAADVVKYMADYVACKLCKKLSCRQLQVFTAVC